MAHRRVFVGTDAGTVVALGAASGKIRWTSAAAPPSAGAVIRSSPAVDHGRVFVATAETSPMDGNVVAFDEVTGATDWRATYIADYSTSYPRSPRPVRRVLRHEALRDQGAVREAALGTRWGSGT